MAEEPRRTKVWVEWHYVGSPGCLHDKVVQVDVPVGGNSEDEALKTMAAGGTRRVVSVRHLRWLDEDRGPEALPRVPFTEPTNAPDPGRPQSSRRTWGQEELERYRATAEGAEGVKVLLFWQTLVDLGVPAADATLLSQTWLPQRYQSATAGLVNPGTLVPGSAGAGAGADAKPPGADAPPAGGDEQLPGFDRTIGQLDFVLSKLMGYAREAAAGRLSEPNRQTLKHHAEDMEAAAKAIHKRLRVEEDKSRSEAEASVWTGPPHRVLSPRPIPTPGAASLAQLAWERARGLRDRWREIIGMMPAELTNDLNEVLRYLVLLGAEGVRKKAEPPVVHVLARKARRLLREVMDGKAEATQLYEVEGLLYEVFHQYGIEQPLPPAAKQE